MPRHTPFLCPLNEAPCIDGNCTKAVCNRQTVEDKRWLAAKKHRDEQAVETLVYKRIFELVLTINDISTKEIMQTLERFGPSARMTKSSVDKFRHITKLVLEVQAEEKPQGVPT